MVKKYPKFITIFVSTMLSLTNNQMKKLTRQVAICAVLVAMVILTFASKGGGGDKKNNNFRSNFTPIRSLNSFTLKTSSSYNSGGSYVFNQGKENNRVSLNTMITYEKGNTIYILPYKYKVNISALDIGQKTNLQFLGVKIKMPK